MAFGTTLYGLACRQDLMCNQNGVVDFRMALNATHLSEMICLIGQPVVTFHDYYLLPFGFLREAVEIGMAAQAHAVIK